MKRKITKRERHKTQEKQVMQMKNICSLPTYQCPACYQAAAPPASFPPSLYTKHDVIWYGIPLWIVWVSCPGCVPSQLLVHSQPLLAGQDEKLRSP